MVEKRKRILNLVEQGKITASEALTLLELLEQEEENKSAKEKEILHDLSNVVVLDEEEQKQQEKEEATQKKIASAKDMILNFVDNIVTKVKEVDLNFTKYATVPHIYHDQVAAVSEVNIEVANGDVEVIAWDGPGVKVECDAKVYRTENEETARKTLLEEATFNVNEKKLYFVVGQKWMRVNSKVYVPTTHYDKVRIKLFNGAIQVSQLTINQLKAKTGNGKIDIQNVISHEADFETVNGNIELTNNTFDKLECETINGTVKHTGSFQMADIETFIGSINVEGFTSTAKVLNVQSDSGTVQVTVPLNMGVSGEAKSYLGALHVDVPGMKVTESKNEVIQKMIKFENEDVNSVRVTAESKTASVTIKQAL
ncbi:MAG: DUF4097 family beta strand repeat-containing protein [Bacillus sp. (in: firmicutes)]